MEYLRYLERTQWASREELHDLQAEKLRTLVQHAYAHTDFYRQRLDAAQLAPSDIATPADLERLPLLSRAEARDSATSRTSKAPPFVAVKKTTSGTMGQPLPLGYNIESEHWRTAIKLRGYGWAGYHVGARALHYWGIGAGPPPTAWRQKLKIDVDRRIKREQYIDCTPRGQTHLTAVVEHIRQFRPEVIVTYSQAGASLARFINRTGARSWSTIPVICGAERLWEHDRQAMELAFGPAVFETYGCREFMLLATECEHHDGLHVQMENVLVEVVVREADGSLRAAQAGETGEVAVTDLNNLAMPFIRYVNGDLATARGEAQCHCRRWHPRIGPIEGRVTETLRDGDGNPVSGLVFNILFCDLAEAANQFQAVQHTSGDITLKVVPSDALTDATLTHVRQHCEKYLPGVRVRVEMVADIPPTKSGKRNVVVVERDAESALS